MAATLAGIVIGTVSRIPRRLIMPSTDAELDNMPLAPGETLLKVSKAQALDMPSLVGIIAGIFGVLPAAISDGRCAVLDGNGNVVSIVYADPLLDSIPGMTLFASPTAMLGDKVVAGILVPQSVSLGL